MGFKGFKTVFMVSFEVFETLSWLLRGLRPGCLKERGF